MLPIKLLRSITNDRRAQAIGNAISITNEIAALKYLENTPRRAHIEKLANSFSGPKVINPGPEDRWIDREWSTHWGNAARRKKAGI